jgi:thiol-disulfide isomerase/thioredoxin
MRPVRSATLLLSLACAQAFGQQLPDADSLMKQVADAAKRYHSLQFVSENTSETASGGGKPFKMVSKVTETHVTPGKSRIESSTAGMTVLVVSNAEFTYVYSSSKKEYVKIPAGLGPAGMMSAMGMKLPDLDSIHQSYKTLRDETLEIDGVKHDCWVLEDNIGDMAVPLPQGDTPPAKATGVAMTMWVDKKLLITLQTFVSMKMEFPNTPTPDMRTMEMHQTTLVKNLKIDQPVDESLFTFTPPEGAKEVKELSFASAALPKADLTGKDAPAFEIRGLDGKLYKSTALRGKTVLLDFWATWCVPCRQSIPSVEKIYAEYKDRGLMALAVNVEEAPDVVEAFVKKAPFAYPVVSSGESGIVDAYKVTAYPTFVLIGPDGKVVAHEIGFGGEQMLRRMIGKAVFASSEPRP